MDIYPQPDSEDLDKKPSDLCDKRDITREANIEARDSDEKTPIEHALWKYRVNKYELGVSYVSVKCESVKILVKAQAELKHLKGAKKARIGG